MSKSHVTTQRPRIRTFSRRGGPLPSRNRRPASMQRSWRRRTAAVRDSTSARPSPARDPWWQRWQPLAAAAAVTGLAFVLLQSLPREEPVRLPSVAPAPPAPAAREMAAPAVAPELHNNEERPSAPVTTPRPGTIARGGRCAAKPIDSGHRTRGSTGTGGQGPRRNLHVRSRRSAASPRSQPMRRMRRAVAAERPTAPAARGHAAGSGGAAGRGRLGGADRGAACRGRSRCSGDRPAGVPRCLPGRRFPPAGVAARMGGHGNAARGAIEPPGMRH